MSKRLVYLILGAVLICAVTVITLLSVLSPSGTAQQDGLQASLTTDKDSYDENETIIVDAALTNSNGFAVSGVQAELALNSGLTLKSGEQTHTFGLKAGETLTIPYEVTAGTATALPGGGNLWLWLAAALGVALLILLLVLLLRRKRSQPPADMGASGKKTASRVLSLVIVLLLLFPYIASGTTAFAQEDSAAAVTQADGSVASDAETSAAAQGDIRSFSVAKSVSVNGASYEMRVTFTYTVMAGAKTVTFETNGGSEIQPLMMQTGGTLFDMPMPVKDGAAFIGWYTDEALTQAFYSDTPIDQDMTLYAQYAERDNDVEIDVEPVAYMEDCSDDIAFKIVSPISLTAENLSQYIEFKAYLGDIPELTVTAGDGGYTITPVTPYTAGGHYRFTLLDDRLSFSGEDAFIRGYAFRIYKEKAETVKLNDNIKYVLWDDVTTLSEGVYSVRSSDYKIETGDVVCFWNGTYDNDMQMSNVLLATSVTGNATTPGTTVIYMEDSDIDDVFEDINVFTEQDIPMSAYLPNVDTDKIAAEAKASKGTRQLTQFLALALNASPSVASLTRGGSPAGNMTITTLDDAMPPELPPDYFENDNDDDDDDDDSSDFVTPSENGAVGITVDDLVEGLSITATLGTARNENFYNAGPDDWAVLTLTFDYNTVIKDKVEVKAQFKVKEYIKASMQGWKTKKGTYLEFDYALNMYSQTNVSLSVLIRSKDTSEDDYFDVTEELENLIGDGEEENDGSEVETILTEVLGNKGDDIELVDVSLFSYPLVLVPEIPVFQINYDLNFVVSVNFAAGISAETNIMGAKQVGFCGNTRDGIDTYENTLPGSNRYDFDLYCAGYFGIKTGLKMSISLSIYGMKEFGEIGMSGEVGVYMDLYGFLQLHIDKYYQHSDDYNLRLQGGVYMEFGVYVKLTIFAKSDKFKAKAEYVPYEQKIKLLSVGERYVLLNFANSGQAVVINTEKYSIKDNPALLDAEYIDLTTGKKVTGNYYDPSKFTMTFSSRYFAYSDQAINVLKNRFADYNTQGVTENTKRLDTEVTIYYLGNNMTFSNDEYGYTNKTADLTWVDSSIDPNQYDDIDTVTATYVVDFGGKQTTLGSREVLFGQVPGSIDMTEYIRNGTVTGYDNDFNQPIFENTTYTVYISPYQRLVSFLTFYDGSWHLDVYPVNAGATPVLPEGYDASAGMPFRGWTRTLGSKSEQVNNVDPLETDITQYGSNYIYEGLDTTKPLYSVAGSYDQCEQAYYEEDAYKSIPSRTSSLYLYTAKYDMPDCTVTFKFPSLRIPIPDGTLTLSEKTYEFTFQYGQQLQCPYQPNFQYTDLLGWDADGDGEVDYGVEELPMATGDMTMTAVEEVKTFRVTVLDKDGKKDRTVDVKLGDLPSLLETEPEYPGDTDEYEFEGWMVSENGVDFELWNAAKYPGVYEDWTIKPGYTRLYTINFDFAGGVYNGETSRTVVVKAGEYTVSSIMNAVPLKPSDTYNTYVFSGWSCGASLTVSDDTTVTAQYTETAIVYTAEFHTGRGTFVNGKTDDTFEGGYDEWQTFIQDYLEQNTKSTVAPVLTDDTVWSFERWNAAYANSYTVRYDAVWKSAPREYAVTFNAGEGVFSEGGTTRTINNKTWHATGDFTAYNGVIKSADVYTTFKLSGWIDQNGTTYAPTDTYTVTGDMMFTPIFVEDQRVEYTVSVSAGRGEFPDGDIVKTFTGYYGDPTNIIVADPAYEITASNIYYVFSGWSNDLPTTFTSNMTITAQYDTMYYEYTITFDAGLGTFAGGAQTVEKTYHYDETVSISETPTRAEDDYFTYAFDGWNPPLRKVDGDRTYVATYEAIPKGATMPNAGIIITDGTTSADISANHLPGEYQYQMEIAGSGSIPVLRITGSGLTISGSSSSVYIIIEEGVSTVTFNGLQLSGAYEYGYPLEFKYNSNGTSAAVTISGSCLVENTFEAKQAIRSNRHMTLTGSGASAELTVKSVDRSAFYCGRGMEVNGIDLNVSVDAGLGNVPYAAAFEGEGIDNPVWAFNDATVTVNSAGYGFNTLYSVEIDGGTWNMQCGKTAIFCGGFEVNGATLTASGAGGLNIINGNATLTGYSQVHLTSTDNTVPVVAIEEAYDAGTGYLRLTDYTDTFIADYTLPPSTGAAVRTDTGIELLVSGTHSPELFNLHGAVIALFNDGGDDYYTFAVESVPATQVQVDRAS